MNREANLFKRVILIFVFTFTLVVLIGVGALFAQKKLAGGSGKGAKDAAEALRMAETAGEEGGDAGRETEDGSDAAGGSAGIPGSADAANGEASSEEAAGTDASMSGAAAEPETSEPAPAGEEDAEPKILTLGFAGDILFDRSYSIQAQMEGRGGGIAGAVGASLLEEMQRVDLMIANNEFPYTDRGAPQPEKTFTFHAAPRTVRQLKEMGIDLAGLANNHCFDYGEQGFLDTLDTLERAGVPYVGAGRNIDAAAAPYLYEQDGFRIAIFCATEIERTGSPDTRGATDTLPGVFRCLDDTRLCNDVQKAKTDGYFVIVFIHWGTEGEEQPDHWQLKQGPEIAEAGADLIIGAHPHCLEPITYIGDVPVVYSLGNFLFNSKTLDTCLVECELEAPRGTASGSGGTAPGLTGSAAGTAEPADGAAGRTTFKSLRFLPCIQSGCTVRFAEDGERDRILQYMRDISPEVTIDAEGWIGKK